MLRIVTLTLLLLCSVEGASRVLVEMGYVGDSIKLSLQLSGSDAPTARDVTFYYFINGRESTGKAAPVGDDWRYELTLAEKTGRFLVSAFAMYTDVAGLLHTTAIAREDATFHSGVSQRMTAPEIPSRQIRGAVIFRDDFNSFDRNKWTHEVSMYGGYNGEFQVYTNDPKNVFAHNGLLYIQPTLTIEDHRFNAQTLHTGVMDMKAMYGTCTNSDQYGCRREGKNGILPPVMSGRINSIASMKYGTVEIRAKIPLGDWLWPTIWLWPKDSKYGGWPKSGEIDIMESRGNQGPMGIKEITSTLHWGPSPNQNRYSKTHGARQAANWHSSFHTWKLEWTPTHIRTTCDNQEVLRVDPGSSFWSYGGFGGNNIWSSGGKMAPFDQEFHMILNVAVGGTNGYFPDGTYNGKNKPWTNNSPQAMEQFWNDHNNWHKTWNGHNSALIIDYVEFKSLH
ncbi:beta-1,3-glucan-binding protein [Aplysia californica]|uniref:Beta-1,3-glucan-binding protein n=1 Tax=Aplysia californica TaxID=6500 RepID=A0ABM1ACL4_APLCA|nr:beta-1,3-glucan-binding protein [Aplysia californica]